MNLDVYTPGEEGGSIAAITERWRSVNKSTS